MKIAGIIKSKAQYQQHAARLKELWKKPTAKNEAEREVLDVFIEKWERDHLKHEGLDPVELIKSLMENHDLDRNRLMEILEISKGTLSKILGYKKGLSKNVIRKLSDHFKISQEAFNRPYLIKSEANRGHKDEKMMNTPKRMKVA